MQHNRQTANELRARLEAQSLANQTGEPHIVFARSCDRYLIRIKSDTKSARAYATAIATYQPAVSA